MTSDPSWDNLGYWVPARSTYSQACRALGERLWRLGGAVSSPRVLDVGCGFGVQLGLWRRAGAADVLGVEPNEARARLARSLYAQDPSIEVVVASAAELRWLSDASRDRVLVLDALYHFPNRQDFIGSARRILVEGGELSFCTVVAPESSAPRTTSLRALGRVFEMPDGVPSESRLRSELLGAGLDQIVVQDWSSEVLGGFAEQGDAALSADGGWRRRARVAMTRWGCRAALRLGVRYVGVNASANG